MTSYTVLPLSSKFNDAVRAFGGSRVEGVVGCFRVRRDDGHLTCPGFFQQNRLLDRVIVELVDEQADTAGIKPAGSFIHDKFFD